MTFLRITGAQAWLVPLRLKQPYSIAYESISEANIIFLRLDTTRGISGFGCAAPDAVVTRETAQRVLTATDDLIIPVLKKRNPLHRSRLLADLRKHIDNMPSALAMADMALFDILGKVAGLPLCQLLGGFRNRMLTSITLGIMPLPETLEQARHYISQGFKALKLKGGVNVDEDIEKIRKLREIFGRTVRLRFDANQGYSHLQALKFAEQVHNFDLELLEQPTPRENLQLLGRVTQQTQIPIMADESLMNLRDVFRLARKALVDMVNIKLMKTGGLAEALQIDAVARAAGINTMIGCMDESALSIAAGLHFALARPNVTHADLDGHFDLAGDPAKGAVLYKNGYLYPTGRPGIGFAL